MRPPVSSQDGAVLILVAVGLLVLIGFSAIVVDYGILWVSRSQAQAAADAGALAGAVAITANASNAEVRVAARAYAQQTPVWGEYTAPADIVVSTPLPCPPGSGGGNKCVRVDVFRGALDRNEVAHTNTLPIFFGSLLGVTTQGVRATATAQAADANASKCIKPWAVADKWFDSTANGWDQADTYAPASGDAYRPPGDAAPTGFTLEENIGLQMALKAGAVGKWSSGWTQEIDFPGHPGSSNYQANIEGCPDWVPLVGLYAGQQCNTPGDTDPDRGCLGAKTGMSQGPTSKGVKNLVNQDDGAYWNGTQVVSPAADSPRVVPIVVFNTGDYVNSGCSGTNCMVKVVNILGFFVEGMCDDVQKAGKLDPGTVCDDPSKTVVGRLVAEGGQYKNGAGTNPGTFLLVPRLVR